MSSKTVHVLPDGASNEFAQGLYLDRSTMTLIPDLLFVNESGEPRFETNSLGLRGPEPQEGEQFAVVWGDSVVFSFPEHVSWPELIEDGTLGCLFLNGGVEGTNYRQILKRATEMNRRRPANLNVILLGWLELCDNRDVAEDLIMALDEIPNPVLVTQPTSLNSKNYQTDISGSFVPFVVAADIYRSYKFLGTLPYDVNVQAACFAHICERNAILTSVAQSRGVPVIDLFTALDSAELDDFRAYFFDLSHPRPHAYPMLANLVREAVRPLLMHNSVPASRF